MGAHANDANLCTKEFSKSLTDQAYTWNNNLKPGSMHDWEHLISFSTLNISMSKRSSFGRARKNVSIPMGGPGRVCKEFYGKALDCSVSMVEEVFVDVSSMA